MKTTCPRCLNMAIVMLGRLKEESPDSEYWAMDEAYDSKLGSNARQFVVSH
jgi:hypothetical protein